MCLFLNIYIFVYIFVQISINKYVEILNIDNIVYLIIFVRELFLFILVNNGEIWCFL